MAAPSWIEMLYYDVNVDFTLLTDYANPLPPSPPPPPSPRQGEGGETALKLVYGVL